MAIRITGMYSGLDTESIISELVSAQSVKKSSMVKAQTKLSWKQDAWKALNTKIFSFYSNTLSNMRFQASYKKKTTKVSNSNAISVVTGADAVDGVRTVKVNQLAKGGYLTGADLTGEGDVGFTGAASLESLLKHSKLKSKGLTDDPSKLNGSFSVVGADGSSYKINVNSNTTINDVVDQLQKAGLNANYDQDSQRIFVSAKNTGKDYNFSLVGDNEGGMNALAVLGLLSSNDLNSSEYTKWAAYKDASGNLTEDGQKEYDKMLADQVAAYKAEWDSLTASTKAIEDSIAALNDNDAIGLQKTGTKLSEIYNKLYKDADADGVEDGGLYSNLYKEGSHYDNLYKKGGLSEKLGEAKAAYEEVKDNDTITEADKNALKQKMDDAQTAYDAEKALYDAERKAYDDAKAEAMDFLDIMRDGPLEEKKDAEGKVVYEQEKDDKGNLVFKEDGVTPVYTDKPVMEHNGKGLLAKWELYQANGTLPSGVSAEDLKAQIDSYNKWIDAFEGGEKDRDTLVNNKARLEEIKKYITFSDVEEDGETKTVAKSTAKLEKEVQDDFDAKVKTAQDVTAYVGKDEEGNVVVSGKYANLAGGTKIDGQDAEILLNGAKFTSSTNTFTVNGLTLTAMEETSSEVTLTTSTDTDGIYDMIKNFFSEYNKLINEMDSLYNAESSKGYDPLTSEEKDALTDTEVEEWEKKIKDSLLRRDSTLRTVSNGMTSILLQGASVNGKQMYLSDFGIATLGYFKSKDNERNAYHIDGDSDDVDTKGAEDKLKAMIASDPDTVMNFFSQLSTNLYNDLTDKMSSIKDTRSAFTVYNDKVMKKEYDAYTDKIKKEEEKLNKLMDSWYSKFSKMETALSKLESKNNSLASLFGN